MAMIDFQFQEDFIKTDIQQQVFYDVSCHEIATSCLMAESRKAALVGFIFSRIVVFPTNNEPSIKIGLVVLS